MKKIVIPENYNNIIATLISVVLFSVIFLSVGHSFSENALSELIKVCAIITAVFFVIQLSFSYKGLRRTLALFEEYIEIDGVKIPWNQIFKFECRYGVMPLPKGPPVYQEIISVRAYHNQKIYAFDNHTSNKKVLAHLDTDENLELIKNRINQVEQKTDEEVIGHKRKAHQFLFLSILAFVFGWLNFIGLLTFLKYDNYSAITIDNNYLYLALATFIALFIIASITSFINLKSYALSERFRQTYVRMALTLFLSFTSVFSVRLIIAGLIYRSSTVHKDIDFTVWNTNVRSVKDRRSNYQVLDVWLQSEELPDYNLSATFSTSCLNTLKIGSSMKVRFYKTQDNQLYYISTIKNRGEAACRI